MDTRIPLVRHLAGDNFPLAFGKIEELERRSMLITAVTEPFLQDIWTPDSFIDGQMISDDWGFLMFAVLEFEDDRPFAAARAELLEPPAPVPGLAQALGEALIPDICFIIPGSNGYFFPIRAELGGGDNVFISL